MLPATTLLAALSYALMVAAYLRPRNRAFHAPAMLAVMLFDLGMPIYLYTHRHWWHRLIEQQDILSFLVWMHFGLLLMLYILDALQLRSAFKLWHNDHTARATHRAQGQALLVIRGLVILTGAVLA